MGIIKVCTYILDRDREPGGKLTAVCICIFGLDLGPV